MVNSGKLEWQDSIKIVDGIPFYGTCKVPVVITRTPESKDVRDLKELIKETSIQDINLARNYEVAKMSKFVVYAREKFNDSMIKRGPDGYVEEFEGRLFPTMALRQLVWQVARAIKILHSKGYRLPNMKPEDIEYENNCVKIAHFSVKEKPDLEVRAPEEVLDPQTSSISSDLFRFGHIIWAAIAGADLLYTPEDYTKALKGKDEKGLYNLIDKKLQKFVVAAEIRDLLLNLLTLDPKKRYSIDEILRHPLVWRENDKTELLCALAGLSKKDEKETTARASERAGITEAIDLVEHRILSRHYGEWYNALGSCASGMTTGGAYDVSKLTELLRLFRNVKSHITQMPEPTVEELERWGGLYRFFELTFHNLVMALYRSIRDSHLTQNRFLRRFYSDFTMTEFQYY